MSPSGSGTEEFQTGRKVVLHTHLKDNSKTNAKFPLVHLHKNNPNQSQQYEEKCSLFALPQDDAINSLLSLTFLLLLSGQKLRSSVQIEKEKERCTVADIIVTHRHGHAET